MHPAAEIESVRVDDIHIPDRHRKLVPAAVEQLRASLEAIGLQTPIHVRYVEEMEIRGKTVCNVPVLVAGAHRLSAAKQLGWERIPCISLDGDEIDAELWEIDENLARAELTPAEIAAHMARRKALWEQKQVGQLVPPSKPQYQKGFAQDTAEKTGQSKRDVNRAVARGEKIAPDVLQAVTGTKLDTGISLDKLAKMPVEQQRRAVSEVKLPAEPLNEFEATQKQIAALMSAWNKAGPEAREQFLDRIERPVFDNTRAGAA